MTKKRFDRWNLLLGAATLTALCSGAGCGSNNQTVGLANVGPDGGTAGGAATGPLTDPQILGVLLAADDGEIAQAQLAHDRSHDTGVLAFADRMIVEHGATNMQIAQLQLTPEPSPVSAQVTAHAQRIALRLTSIIRTHAFDVDYASAQVEMHTELLSLLDTQLIPQAQDATLQAFLVNAVRPQVASHLREAKTIGSILDHLGTVLTDAQGAALFGLGTQSEISRGQMAETKATAPAVTQFATGEVTEHTAIAQQLAQLVQTLGLGAPDVTAFLPFFGGALQAANELFAQAAPGAQFDHVYMENQIAIHSVGLMLIDDILLPSAQAAEWRAFLESVRPTLQDHLTSAEQIVVSLPFAP